MQTAMQPHTLFHLLSHPWELVEQTCGMLQTAKLGFFPQAALFLWSFKKTGKVKNHTQHEATLAHFLQDFL